MKIFFHAPITERMSPVHEVFFKYLEELGHSHTTTFSVSLKNQDLFNEQIRKKAKDLLRGQEVNIKKADVVIFGASEQSIGTGIYLDMALNLSKPIIALCENRKTMPFIYDALDYDKLIIQECTLDNYKDVIPQALEKAKRLIDKRFTLLLPPDVVEMLENHHKETGETRSDYIRDLIRTDQEASS